MKKHDAESRVIIIDEYTLSTNLPQDSWSEQIGS